MVQSQHGLGGISWAAETRRDLCPYRHGVLRHAVPLAYRLANLDAARASGLRHEHGTDLPYRGAGRSGQARAAREANPLPDLQRLRRAAIRFGRRIDCARPADASERQTRLRRRGPSRRRLGAGRAKPRTSFTLCLISRSHRSASAHARAESVLLALARLSSGARPAGPLRHILLGDVMKPIITRLAFATLLINWLLGGCRGALLRRQSLLSGNARDRRYLRRRRIVHAHRRRVQEWRRSVGRRDRHRRGILEDDHAEFRHLVRETWIHLDTPGEGTASGFDNLGTSFKYQFVRDADRELAMSVSLDADWGGTGAKAVDAKSFTTLTPTLFLGKGFGFMNAPLLKPFAVTAQVGYAIPTKTRRPTRRGDRAHRHGYPIRTRSYGAARCNTACLT